MGQKSNIEWCDATWNIARGCTKVDEDCKACYMYRDSMNSTRYDPMAVVRTKTVFDLPLRIKEPSKIFTCSLTDFFHEAIDSYRHEAWDIIRRCPQHTFQILTKRPERIVSCLPADWGYGWPNVWLGTSVGSEKGLHRANILERLDIPMAVRFISFEPLHGYIETNWDLGWIMRFQWVIIGGESGNETGKYRYRPCELHWMEELLYAFDSCGVPVFVKQMGTHLAKAMNMSDRHGVDISEFPSHLQIRQFPKQ
jgi:protein gp37